MLQQPRNRPPHERERGQAEPDADGRPDQRRPGALERQRPSDHPIGGPVRRQLPDGHELAAGTRGERRGDDDAHREEREHARHPPPGQHRGRLEERAGVRVVERGDAADLDGDSPRLVWGRPDRKVVHLHELLEVGNDAGPIEARDDEQVDPVVVAVPSDAAHLPGAGRPVECELVAGRNAELLRDTRPEQYLARFRGPTVEDLDRARHHRVGEWHVTQDDVGVDHAMIGRADVGVDPQVVGLPRAVRQGRREDAR